MSLIRTAPKATATPAQQTIPRPRSPHRVIWYHLTASSSHNESTNMAVRVRARLRERMRAGIVRHRRHVRLIALSHRLVNAATCLRTELLRILDEIHLARRRDECHISHT